MEHLGTVALETPRLILRPFQPDDAPAMYRNWACDPEVTKFLTWPPHASPAVTSEIVQSWVASYADPDPAVYQWAIVLKELGEPVGSISVVRKDDAVDSVELGYCIGRPWWHQGVTSEAVAELIRFFFEDVGANRVAARHDVRNPHSGGVMKKCGMAYEGTRRQADKNNQGVCDAACYAILRQDYLNRKGRSE